MDAQTSLSSTSDSSLKQGLFSKLKNFWRYASLRKRISILSGIFLALVATGTPLYINNQQEIRSHAGSSLLTNCISVPSGLTQSQIQQLSQNGQVKWCNSNQFSVFASMDSLKNLPQYSFGLDTSIRAGGSEWSNPTLIHQMQQMQYQTMRFPGGLADEYDWKTGKYDLSFNNGPLQSSRWSFGGVTTLQQLKTLYDQLHATPIFVLNVVTSGNNIYRSCGSASSWNSDWQAMLDDQIQYLKTAQSLGLPVKLVELGNEVYGTTAQPSCLFPTGAVYGTIMNSWIDALHSTFPGVKVALVGDPTNEGNTWNKDMLTTAKNFDAITVHLYADEVKGFDESADQCTVQKAEYSSLQSYQGVANLLSGLSWWHGWYQYQISLNFPQNVKLWITESGPSDIKYGFSGTWAEGMYAAGYYMYLLRHPQVEEVNDFVGVDDSLYGEMFQVSPVPGYQGDRQKCTPFPQVLPYAYTPKGFNLQLIGQSLHGMTQYAPIIFNPNPLLNGKNADGSTDYSLIGEVYTNGTKYTAVVLNLSAKEVSLNLLLPQFLSYTQYSSLDPAMLTTGNVSSTGGANTVKSTSGAIDSTKGNLSTIKLPPYSITALNQNPFVEVPSQSPTPSVSPASSTQFQIYVFNEQGKGVDGVKVSVSDNGALPVSYVSKNAGQILVNTTVGHTINAILSSSPLPGYTASYFSISAKVYPFSDTSYTSCGQENNSCLFHLIPLSSVTVSPTPTPATDATKFQIYVLDSTGKGVDSEQVKIADSRNGTVLNNKTYTSQNGGEILVPTSIGDYITADAVGPYTVTSNHIGAVVYSYTDTSKASCGESDNSCLFHVTSLGH